MGLWTGWGWTAPFRHLVTPGGYTMSVAMTNCGLVSWVTILLTSVNRERRQMSKQALMNESQWNIICATVRDEMAALVWPTVTPISLSHDLTHGWAHGTGNYLQLRGAPYLLTNEHVVAQAQGFHIAHLPGPTDNYVLCNTPILADPWPIDLALTRLPQNPSGLGRDLLTTASFERSFSPVENELLFWVGFPGSKASRHEAITDLNAYYSWFGALEVPGIPMLTQLFPTSAPLRDFDPVVHVAVHYPALAQQSPAGALVDVRNPKGMSGSLLWDTKFVARTMSSYQWSVDDARVCGLVWAAHEKPEIVVATRIEYVLPTLLHFLREECAYFHWIHRGRPLWEAWVDWMWAEHEVPDLGS